MSYNFSFVKSEEEMAFVREEGRGSNFSNQEKIQIFWTCDEAVARRVLPPGVEPYMPMGFPIISAYVANYHKPQFMYSYPESALFITGVCEGHVGAYCLSMTLCGSDQASDSGREFYKYPKKQGIVQFGRSGDRIYGYAERNYIRFFEFEASIGAELNNPEIAPKVMGKDGYQVVEGDSLLLQYDLNTIVGPDNLTFVDHFKNVRMVAQHNITTFETKEYARIDNMVFRPSEDDPWVEVMPKSQDQIFGAYYTHFHQEMRGCQLLHQYTPEERKAVEPYLFLAWDTCWLGKEHTALTRVEA